MSHVGLVATIRPGVTASYPCDIGLSASPLSLGHSALRTRPWDDLNFFVLEYGDRHHPWLDSYVPLTLPSGPVSPITDPFQISLIVCIHLHNSTVFDIHVYMATLRVQEGLNFTGIFADIDAVSTGDSAVDGMYKSPSSSSVFSFGEELIYMKNSSKLTWIVCFKNERSVNSDNSMWHPTGTCSSCPWSQQKEES